MSKHAGRDARARQVMPGYPKTFVFQTPEEIADYFNHVELTCLLCGQHKKSLSIHLKKIHGISVDDYREMYGLPWRKGLIGTVTHKYCSDHGKEMVESGLFGSTEENRAKAMIALKTQKKRAKYREVLTNRNLDAMNCGKSGEEAQRRREAPKRGTKEHREQMLARPQTAQPSKDFTFFWVGKTQSYDHVLKRTGSPPKR